MTRAGLQLRFDRALGHVEAAANRLAVAAAMGLSMSQGRPGTAANTQMCCQPEHWKRLAIP